jgi:aspartyl-tRNA synthetase
MLLTNQTTIRDVILFPAMRNLPAGTGALSFGLPDEIDDEDAEASDDE